MIEPGRYLDVEIARRVVRLAVILDPDGEAHRMVDAARRRIVPVPHYSTDENDNYFMINMLQGQGYTCNVNSNVGTGDIIWSVVFQRADRVASAQSRISMPHAACLAALELLNTQES